ncbi:ANM_HP_G0101060.mRNA.1.CDS.1 [Saccharomyces cerevisiae]|nr:ANM_HP_G0101060.mRNA.1.CDS.1 [Saccharomyces cerevisiae]CAI6409854.1 ANM_HP_G0101060.mRNA.1.CDS.1 [Saccharomyces cerevisiae]
MMLQSYQNSLDDFLRKDIIYASFQLSASALSEMVFTPNYKYKHIRRRIKVIRRRVALIINRMVYCEVFGRI